MLTSAVMTAWNALLREKEHRPWALPSKPWVMTMAWVDLLFAHWTVSVEALRAIVPAKLELDLFEGRAYVGVVPFRMEGVGPRFLSWMPEGGPSPRAFPELNVRTYVRVGDKPGVFFFSLDATSRLAVWGARTFFDLPYMNAAIKLQRDGDWITYDSRRRDARGGEGDFVGRYRPMGEPYLSEPGSLEYWLTERYCLYADNGRGRIKRGEVHHVPWPLQRAEAEIETNTAANQTGLRTEGPAALLHFVDRIDVLAWWPDVIT